MAALHITPDDRLFVLTGAGISAESGLPTFRGMNGLWRQRRVEEVASPVAWARDPRLVWEFYSERRRKHQTVAPNPGHFALAALEERLGDRLFLCTQNVDGLHELAGSRRVVHMHGKLMQSRCDRCSRPPFDDDWVLEDGGELRRCHCGGLIRPHICWFGETPFELDLIFDELARCSLFLAVGTSGVVEPAASFVRFARSRVRGVRALYVGPEEPANAGFFDDAILGPSGEVLPRLFGVSTSQTSRGTTR